MNHMSKEENLVFANVSLKCADDNHEGTCELLRDILLNQFNNVLEAEVVKTVVGSPDFCVIATAKITASNKTSFEKALKNMRVSDKKSPLLVTNSRVLLAR